MAWNTALPIMVRSLIGDFGSTETYTDERLNIAIAVAAIMVQQELSVGNSYIVDVETPCIEPDPTDSDTLDYEAIALFTLKAACILSVNNYQSAIGRGIKVTDWNSSVDTTGRFSGYKDIISLGPCASYQKILEVTYHNSGTGKGRAVLGPYGNRCNYHGRGSLFGNQRWDVGYFFDNYLSCY